MAHGRSGLGLIVLLLVAGGAAAQPAPPGTMPLGPIKGGSGVPALYTSSGPVAGSVPGSLPPLIPPGQLPTANIQTGAAFADDHATMREIPSGLPELVPTPDKHANEDHDVPAYLSPFAPHHGWYTDGEFLLMRARNTDFDYAIKGSNVGLGTVGPIDTLKFTLGAGLYTELGYRFGEGKWEAAFGYTYFGDHGGATDAAGPGQVLFPTLTRPGLVDYAQTANVHAELDYELFDLIVGRRVVVDEHFALRFVGGFRFADIRQRFNAAYNGDDARQDAVNTRSSFQGFGPIAGMEAVLGGWRGFHLYSRATVGLMSGLSTNNVIETNDSGGTTYVNTNYDVRKVVPMGSLALGGGWQYRTLSIRAGYQITQWQGLYERPRFVNDVAPGTIITRPANLTLEGLFLQAVLSF